MIHFQAIIRTFRRCPSLFASAFVLWAFLTPIHALAQQLPAHSTATPAACPLTAGTPLNPMFRNLRHIVLDIGIGYKPLESVECHRNPEECKQMVVNGGLFTRTPSFMKILRNPHHRYPKALYPANLEAIFRPVIEKNWMPFVLPDAQCHRSELTVFDSDFVPMYSKEYIEYLNRKRVVSSEPDTLIVFINVEVDDSLDQNIAVITDHLYRATGCNLDSGWSYTNLIAAIPLSQTPNSVIGGILKRFANDTGAFRAPDVHVNAQY